MSGADEKQTLHRYLRNARGVLLWKLEGLSDYDIRRPMTPTGTNLLGLVKHCAGVECGYFGDVVDRPFPGQDDLDWPEDDAEPGGGMYATETETRELVTEFYRRVWAHSDATIQELPLDARGTVPWWPAERRHPTLHTLLVHTIQETARHAGARGRHQGIHRRCCRAARGCRWHAASRCRRLETALRQAGKHRPLDGTVTWGRGLYVPEAPSMAPRGLRRPLPDPVTGL